MLQFAANLSMLFHEVPFLERFALAKQAGFQAVEFLFPYAYSPQELARQLQGQQLQQVLFNFPPGNWEQGERGIAALPGREQEFHDGVNQALGYAEVLNCPRVHLMAGVVPAEQQAAAEHLFIRHARYAADKLAALGKELTVEPLNPRDVPGYLVSSQREAARLIARIDRPNVKLQFDFYHAQVVNGDVTTLFAELAPLVGHVQLASVPQRTEPDRGELNLSYLLAQVEKTGYSGWIGCEYRPQTTTIEGLGWLQPYLSAEASTP